MKVAILCPGFGGERRGTERVTEELVTRLGADYRPIVYGLRRKGCRDDLWQQAYGVEIRRVPGVPRTHPLAKFYSPWARRAGVYMWSPGDFEAMTFAANLLPRLLRDRPDVVLSLAGPAAGRVCRALRALRGTPFLHSAQGMAQGRLEWIHARQRPNRYLALSVPNRQWIEARAPWLKIALIPNGVDCARFTPEGEVAELPLPKPSIIFVGAMDPVKRPELAIRAVASISARPGQQAPSLLMIGDGKSRVAIEQLGRELLRDRFLLLPSIANEELPKYYRACQAFTLATESEPFGIVFLEAMACNLPVVAHQGVVQQWLIGEAGSCCDCTEEAEYAAALSAAIAQPFGTTPRRRAREFDWEGILNRYREVFSEVVLERRQ